MEKTIQEKKSPVIPVIAVIAGGITVVQNGYYDRIEAKLAIVEP